MIRATLIFAGSGSAFLLLDRVWGVEVAFFVAFGLITAMALMIAVTFLWLYYTRATPLALGMSISWAGTAAFKGWWWISYMVSTPDAMRQSAAVLTFLALSFVGAVMHFTVIKRSMGVSGTVFALPIIGLLAAGLAFLALR